MTSHTFKKPQDRASFQAAINAWPQEEPRCLILSLYTMKSRSLREGPTRASKADVVTPDEWAAIKTRLTTFVTAHGGTVPNDLEGASMIILVGPPEMYRRMLDEPDLLNGVSSAMENEASFHPSAAI